MRKEMKMRYRMIFLDLDGTALTSEKRITPRTAHLVQHLEAHGVPVVIATGRAIFAVREFLRDVRLASPVVTLNGAVVFSHLYGAPQEYHPIPWAWLQEFFQVVQKSGRLQNLLFESIHGYYVLTYDHEIFETFTDYRNLPPKVITLDKPVSDPVTNLLLRPRRIPEDKELLYRELNAALDGRIRFFKTSWEWIEGVRYGVNKGAAMERIALTYGIPLDSVVALGDEWNDLEMIQKAGLGVAMGNAVDAIKAVADLVAPSNDEEGAARVLEEIFYDFLVETGYAPLHTS
ncbi:hypothetical protein C7438_1698 [Brockia lithotrophica]|uniref:Cof-like hydrolase n=2 Tax=Brockia lithotrophica TaxID=933949 RepID=A0A660KUY8_9BACL|nr:hypothetical protein C7438_1698 [Brockia lithotrophica]